MAEKKTDNVPHQEDVLQVKQDKELSSGDAAPSGAEVENDIGNKPEAEEEGGMLSPVLEEESKEPDAVAQEKKFSMSVEEKEKTESDSAQEKKFSKSASVTEEKEITKSGSMSSQKKKSSWRRRTKSKSISDDTNDRPEIRPRTKSSSCDPREGVELALGKGRLQDLPPKTVVEVFKETVRRIPDSIALRYKESSDGEWMSITYSEYYDQVIQAAKSFMKLGVERFYSVCIIGFNSPEWVVANLGAMFAGGLPSGIYTTNGPEACHFVASNCKANVIVVEDQMQLDKILQIRSRLPDLKAIVQYRGEVSSELQDVYSWKQFMDLGKDVQTSEVESILDSMKPEQCALLIYTSGTTGNPKGVMLSHDNLTWTANCLSETYGSLEFGNEHFVSYLPMSHMAAQMADVYMAITIGGTVHFAQADALKGTLGATLRDAQPTIFFGVPRVYEKIMEFMQTKLSETKGFKKKIIKWGAKKGIKGNYSRQNIGQSLPLGWSVAEKLVFSKVRDAVGFRRAKVLVIGSAPTRQEVHEFFMSFDMPLMELYGMSESSGPQTFNVNTVEGKWKTGSCGPLVPGAHLKIHEPNENGEGEICFYGRHVFMGYLNNEEKTKEAIDEEGWLHSGDIGKVDEEGFLYITGRIKELIITSGGENIPPVPIEYRIKSEVPFLSNVFVIGDHRKYLTCLITLLCKMDPDTGEPLDELAPAAQECLEELGCSCTKVSEVLQSKNSAVYAAIQEGLDKANKEAISNAQRVQKFTILLKDFSIPGGELGPTLKVRRPKVVAKYEAEIDSMYN